MTPLPTTWKSVKGINDSSEDEENASKGKGGKGKGKGKAVDNVGKGRNKSTGAKGKCFVQEENLDNEEVSDMDDVPPRKETGKGKGKGKSVGNMDPMVMVDTMTTMMTTMMAAMSTLNTQLLQTVERLSSTSTGAATTSAASSSAPFETLHGHRVLQKDGSWVLLLSSNANSAYWYNTSTGESKAKRAKVE